MTLHWGQAYINKCIPAELQARFNEVSCDPFYGDQDLTLPHYNGKTGEKLFAMAGERPVRISRRKLRSFLSEGLHVHVRRQLRGPTVRADHLLPTVWEKVHVGILDIGWHRRHGGICRWQFGIGLLSRGM